MAHNFHIGQDIVCIKTHSQGVVREGDVFTVKALRKPCCYIQIDIGMYSKDSNGSGLWSTTCHCGRITENGTNNTFWFSERLFAPLNTLTDISEIEEILKQPIYH